MLQEEAVSFLVNERFHKKVDIQGPWDCWVWIGARNVDGYGNFGMNRAFYKAHRVAFEWSRGRPIKPGMEIMHLCDNPSCVNPCHLVEGTHRENMQDSWEKGRLRTVIQTPETLRKQKENTPKGDRHWTRSQPEKLQEHLQGSANGNSKLTELQVQEIRRLRNEEHLTLQELGRRFGVSHSLIGNIVRGKIWAADNPPQIPSTPRRKVAILPIVTKPQKARSGSANGNSKLTEAQVREIRRLRREENLTLEAIGERFGITGTVVGKIVRRQLWASIED